MNEYGKEYFQGNKNELLKEILQIVENYNSWLYKKIKINGTLKAIFFKKSLSHEVVKNTKVKKRFHRTVYDFKQSKEKNKLT
jgi:hypothetical protein